MHGIFVDDGALFIFIIPFFNISHAYLASMVLKIWLTMLLFKFIQSRGRVRWQVLRLLSGLGMETMQLLPNVKRGTAVSLDWRLLEDR